MVLYQQKTIIMNGEVFMEDYINYGKNHILERRGPWPKPECKNLFKIYGTGLKESHIITGEKKNVEVLEKEGKHQMSLFLYHQWSYNHISIENF